MTTTIATPKVFFSYSWGDDDHQQLVRDLATSLIDNGVDVVLDQWDLKPGQDCFKYMEQMVLEPSITKVLVLCDRAYQRKANARTHGVGVESEIISAEVYGKLDQEKFIAVVLENDDDGQAAVPVYLKSRIFVDLRSSDRYGEVLDELLRRIFDAPVHKKPALGTPPAFAGGAGALPRVRELAAALRAIEDGKATRKGLEQQFLKALLAELDRQYVKPFGDEADEAIYQAVLKTKALRDQLAEYLGAIASFGHDDPRDMAPFLAFMDDLGCRLGTPIESGTYLRSWEDFYGFFVLEAVSLATSMLMQHAQWATLHALLSRKYLIRDQEREVRPESIDYLRGHFRAFDEFRKQRLRSNAISITGDMLRARCSPGRMAEDEWVAAELFLTLFCAANFDITNAGAWFRGIWFPRATIGLFGTKPLPFFVRASNQDTREGVLRAIGMRSGAALKERLAATETALGGWGRLCSSDGMPWGLSFPTAVNLSVLVA